MKDETAKGMEVMQSHATDLYNWYYFHQHLLQHDKDYAFTHAVMGIEYMRENYSLTNLTWRAGKLP